MYKKNYSMLTVFTNSALYSSCSKTQLSTQLQNKFKKKVFRTIKFLKQKKQKKLLFAIKDSQIYFLGKKSSIFSLSNKFLTVNYNCKNLQKLQFLCQVNKIGCERLLNKSRKLSIDWHSNDLLETNQGIWFSHCFQPFSTRKYWWILLPSQSLLFRLRWETLSKLNVFNKSQDQKCNSLKLQHINWFNEKPLYVYWIIPFFGCLNLLSLSFSKDIGDTLQFIQAKKTDSNSFSFFNENKITSSLSNLLSPNLTTLSWETLHYLNYKKNLLNVSLKFFKKINCYHDSIIYEVSPSWFNSLQEQYIGIYSENEKYNNVLTDLNDLQNTNKKNTTFINLAMEKSINSDFLAKKRNSQPLNNMQLWWDQESFEKNLPLRKVITTLTEFKKEKKNLLNKQQKNSLVEFFSLPIKITNQLSISNSSKNELVWNNFFNQKSKLKWCWYKLSMNNIPFYSINNKTSFDNSNLPRLLWEKYVGTFNYKLNLVERNKIQFPKTTTFINKTNANRIFSPVLGFQKGDLLNDEFSQKLLVGTTTMPLNYLSLNLSNKNLVKQEKLGIPVIFKKPNIIKKHKKIHFASKKTFSPVFFEKNTQFENYLLSNKVNFGTILIGINSEKSLLIPKSKKSFFYKFYPTNLKDKTRTPNFIFEQKSIISPNFSSQLLVNSSSLSNFIEQNKQLVKFPFSWLNFAKNKELSLNLKKDQISLKNKEFYKKFGVLNYINIVGMSNTFQFNFDQHLYDAFKDYLKASFIYDNLFYTLFLNSQDYIFSNKMMSEYHLLGSKIKSKTSVGTKTEKGLKIFLTNPNYTETNVFNSFRLNLENEILYKLKFPVIMSGYFFPETLTNNCYKSLFGGFSTIKKIKRTNGVIKVTIPPAVFALNQLDNIHLKKADFIKKDFLNIKLSENSNKQLTNLMKPESRLFLPNSEGKLNKNSDFNNYSFCLKVYNADNFIYTKNYLSTTKSSAFESIQRPLEPLKRGVFSLTNNFIKKNDMKSITSQLGVKQKNLTIKAGSLGFRLKYLGNSSFYWNYFKTFYGSSNVLKPFNEIFYFSNFYSFFSRNFKKIGINQVLPGNNFLYQKWHPRKREGFFYKRINKLNIKNNQLFQLNKSFGLKPSISKFNSIVELLWGFRAKYKLDEVLQYQKSKYYQSKKAQQTTNDQNDNQINNNSKITLQTLTKSLIKRKRYKKYMRFEVLSQWLRDVLYFRQMSRKVFLSKKDPYLINISQLIQKSKKGRFNQKFLNLNEFFTKLFLGSNLEEIEVLNKDVYASINQMGALTQKPISKLILKYQKKRTINLLKPTFNKNIELEDRKYSFKDRWLNNKKLFIITKRLIPIQQLKLNKKSLHNYNQNLYYNKYQKQTISFSKREWLNRKLSSNLNTSNLYNSSLFSRNNLKIILEPLISTHDSYLNIFDSNSSFTSSNIKKLYLNNSNNRFLKAPKYKNLLSLMRQLQNLGSFILKDLNNYLINVFKKFGREIDITTKINPLYNLDENREINLKQKFFYNLTTNSCLDSQQKKSQNSSTAFNFLNDSSTQIFEKSKKLVRILNLKPIYDVSFHKKTKYMFKNSLIDSFKTNVKNNWIKKIHKNSSIIEINSNNTKNFRLFTNKKYTKTKSQINHLTSILTKFKNFSSSFVLWRNKFQIRRDYLLLSYIYLDYIGALINSLVNNCLEWIMEGTVFSSRTSKFVLMNNFKLFTNEGNKIYNEFIQDGKKSEITPIFPSSHEKFYLGSKLYKNDIIRPKWSFLIMNHLKNHHFVLYEKIVQSQKKETDSNFVSINKNKPTSTAFKFEKNLKNLDNLSSLQETEFKQKKLINDIKQGLQVNKSYSINLLRKTPSVVFYRSMVESYTTDLKYFSHLKSKNQNKYIPIMDSSINNNLYLKYKDQNSKKKILFMKKQYKFQKLHDSVLHPLVEYQNHKKNNFQLLNSFDNKIKTSELNLSNLITFTSRESLPVSQRTKKSNLKVKLRRKIGLFKARILNKKTKIYNGTYLPNLQFAHVSLFIDSNNIFNSTKNHLNRKTPLTGLLEASFTLLISQININNFWLCTIIFHVCLIFTLLTIYKSSIHFCIKSLYSTVFVFNKYFIYVKYRIQRLLKYIYQSNFQSIIENFQQKYSEKYISSLYSSINTTMNFFFKRNSAFSISSRFKKFNQFHFLKNLREDNKVSFKSFFPIFSVFNETSHSEFIRFFHYLTQQNQNLKQLKKMDSSFLQNKSFFSLEAFLQNSYLRSISKNIKNKIKFKNLQETETLETIKLTKMMKKSESKNLKFTFQVFRWNMFLTLLIGESEILAELEPYREMHWYFLKRFPVFLRTVAGKDSIGMVDYQADEKIRLIKQKIRQTIMILYLRSRKYESKLQNQGNLTEKTNKSFLKNRSKASKWSKNLITQKATKKDDVSKTPLENRTNLEKIEKNSSVQTKKSILKSVVEEMFLKSVKKTIKLSKPKKSIRKISSWKSFLTFLGKLSFISRYAKLNKRFRHSIMLFSNPLVFFGPFGTILMPYLIKSFFLVFESKSQFTQSFFNNAQENRNYFQKSELNRKNQKIYELGLKNIGISHQSNIKKNESSFNRTFFDKSLKRKLINLYNSTNPFYQESEFKSFSSNFSEYSFEKHSGNLNLYVRQKMQNFEKLNERNKPRLSFLNNNRFSLTRENIAPKFERDFLTNCLKFLNKYDRIYLSLNKINILKKDNAEKPWLIKAFAETIFDSKNQIIFKLNSSKNIFNELGVSDINRQRSRFINFDTFDPKLRYYRFYTNFSKVLSDVGGLRGELTVHQHLGPLICKVYAGLFLKQRAKNYLLVSGSNKSESLLFIIQALAGEMGMKLFLEDAKRLQRIGRRGINKATKRLEKLFDIAQANTPCLVFIEDIHVIGSKTKMIKVDEEQEDEEILVRSLLSKLIYRKYHKNKSLRETFIDQNLYTGGSSVQRRRSLKPTNPIPKDLVLYQLTRRRAFSNYFNDNIQSTRINTKLFMVQKLSPAFTTNAVLIWKLFKSKIATPNKSIKEAPWIHIPVDALRSIHPLTYSIRVKIAKITLLAIFTMGTRLRLVKDLIRLFEKTNSESHSNFVVFATTTKLSYMDPSLRRPGRLEETINLSSLTSVSTLVRASTFQSQLDNFKTYLNDLPGLSFTFNLIDNTIFSSRLNLREWSVINYIAEDAYQLGFSRYNMSSNKELTFLSQNSNANFTKLKKEFFDMYTKLKNQNYNLNKQKINSLSDKISDSEYLNVNDFNTKLKKQRMTSYEVLNSGSTSDYWQMIFANIILQRKKGLFNFNIYEKRMVNSLESLNRGTNGVNNKLSEKFDSVTFFSMYRKNKSSIFALLAYTQVGQSLASFLPVFPLFKSLEQEKKDVFFDPDQITNLQLWPSLLNSSEFKPQNIFFNRRKTLKVYFLRFFSAKIGEFLFTNPIEWNNINRFDNRTDYARSFTKDGFLNSINGIQPNWSLAHSYIMNIITTSCLYSKSPLITKLLRIEDVSKPRQKQFFESLNAGILFEYSDFHYRTFLKKNMISMEENLNILQSQKFMLNNQGRPLRKYVKLANTNRLWLFRILFTELGSLNEISLRPTSMNYYYRNKIVLKQKLKLSSYQWLNWHLRKPLDQLEEIQDIAYFPCAEKFYNPRHRRWMITNGYWGYWFTFDKIFYQNLYEQYIFESFYKVYLHLDKNRELLDYLVQLLITQETLSETEVILSFKRYAI
jgi:SpoVK/Ycf46/Vps4 family AAA+-type ATPase